MPQEDFEFVKLHEVCRTEDYLGEIEEFRNPQGECFLQAHVRFFKFKPSVFKEFFREWKLFRQWFKAPLWATAEVDDDKWDRFVRRLGFHFQMNVTCKNGDHRRLFYCPPVRNFNERLPNAKSEL